MDKALSTNPFLNALLPQTCLASKYDAWFIQLVNSEVILASECTRTVEGTYRLTRPLRLIVQQTASGNVAIGFAPMIPFMSKESQDFKSVEINASQVLFRVRLSEVLKDGERLARGYHEEVSGIALI